MAIVGVQSAIYGVDDLSTCERFFADFGLVAAKRSDAEIDYLLPEGSHVVLRRADDSRLPKPFAHGPGVRLVVWGVDTPDSLTQLEAELSRDRRVTRGEDATIYCQDDAGLPIGFRVFERRTLTSEEEFTNALTGAPLEQAPKMVQPRNAATHSSRCFRVS